MPVKHDWSDRTGVCSCGHDTYICQVCAREYCDEVTVSEWRKIQVSAESGATIEGNVCKFCCLHPDYTQSRYGRKVLPKEAKVGT